MIVVIVAMGTSVLGALGVAVWWLDRLIQREADSLHRLAEEQSRRLASVYAELHHTRVEVTQTHTDVGVLRKELDNFVYGPPSLRSPQQQRAEDGKRASVRGGFGLRMAVAMVLWTAGCRSAVDDFYVPLASAQADAGCTSDGGGDTAGDNVGTGGGGSQSDGGCAP